MYQDLAEAIEGIKEKGYVHQFEVDNRTLICEKSARSFGLDHLRITGFYQFDQGTNPGDDASLYLIETDSGLKGYLVAGTTIYKNREKAEFLDQLLQKNN